STSMHTLELPAGAGRRDGTGFEYADRAAAHGSVSTLMLKSRSGGAFVLKAKLRGGGAPLLIRPPAPGSAAGLSFRMATGSAYGSHFGGAAGGLVRNVENKLFVVTQPSVAPCP